MEKDDENSGMLGKKRESALNQFAIVFEERLSRYDLFTQLD